MDERLLPIEDPEDVKAQKALAKWNITFLSLAYSCALSTGVLVSIVAPSASVDVCGVSSAMAPISVASLLFGSSLSSAPGSYFMECYGRRFVFVGTCFIVMVGVGLAEFSLISKDFVTLNIAAFLVGFAQGIGQFYRFAVVEVSEPYPKPIAISFVISGGVLAALVGPLGSTASAKLLPIEYTGSFAFMGVLSVCNLIFVSMVMFPKPAEPPAKQHSSDSIATADSSGAPGSPKAQAQSNGDLSGSEVEGMPLSEGDIVGSISSINSAASEKAAEFSPKLKTVAERTPVCDILLRGDVMLAIAVATLAHTTMLLLMGPVTLAIQECEMEYSFTTAAYVLMAHFLMMFSPTFVTGQLMNRFGPFKVSVAGGVVFAAAMAIMLWGQVLWNFTAGMMLVGLAWNLLFSSATVLLTSCYEPQDAIRVQGVNDVFIFGLAGCGSFSSGFIYAAYGWTFLVKVAGVLVIIQLITLYIFWSYRRVKKGKPCLPCRGEEIIGRERRYSHMGVDGFTSGASFSEPLPSDVEGQGSSGGSDGLNQQDGAYRPVNLD